jgi:transposase
MGGKRKDITGQRFGKWTVRKFARVRWKATAFWECECDCGTIAEVRLTDLTGGKSTQCVDCRPKYNERLDLTGHQYGRWAVKEYAGRKNGQSMWKCECDCGTIAEVALGNLRGGRSKGCNGCAYSGPGRCTTHGQSRTPLYQLWNRKFRKVDGWGKFEEFYKDVGDRPLGMRLVAANPRLPLGPHNFKWTRSRKHIHIHLRPEIKQQLRTGDTLSRNVAIYIARKEGVSLNEICEVCKITRERVRQVADAMNNRITQYYGGNYESGDSLNELDKEIISLWNGSGMRSVPKIAGRIGLSYSATYRRFKKLMEQDALVLKSETPFREIELEILDLWNVQGITSLSEISSKLKRSYTTVSHYCVLLKNEDALLSKYHSLDKKILTHWDAKLSRKQIAERVGVSYHTVCMRVKALQKKELIISNKPNYADLDRHIIDSWEKGITKKATIASGVDNYPYWVVSYRCDELAWQMKKKEIQDAKSTN